MGVKNIVAELLFETKQYIIKVENSCHEDPNLYNFKTRKPMIVNIGSELTSESSCFNGKDFTDIRTYSMFVNELHLGIDLELMWVYSKMGRKRTERCEELLEEYGEYKLVFGLDLPVYIDSTRKPNI